MKIVILVTSLGILLGAGLLLYWAFTSDASEGVKFRVSHLLSHRSVSQRSRMQLILEATLGLVLGGLLMWFALR